MSVAARVWSAEALGGALGERAGGRVQAAGAGDAVAGRRVAVVVEPATEEEVAAVLAFADGAGLKVLVRGGGTQLGLGHPPTGGDILLSTKGLDRVIEHEPGDMTATAAAGLTLADFQRSLGEAGQWLALDPALPAGTTIGGLVATAASGPRRLRYGGVRDQIIGVRIARADGTLAKGGGKVVKNVAGFDLPKLFTGSLGTLGVIVAATFRLYPRAASSRTVTLAAPAPGPLFELAVRIIATTLVASAIDITGGGDDGQCALAVRFEASEAATDDQARALRDLAGPLGATAQTLSGEDEEAYWRGAIAGPQAGQPGATVLRAKVSLLPTDLHGWLAATEQRAGRAGVALAWRAHAGHGIIDARLSGPAGALPGVIAEARALAVAQRGSLVVTDAPPEIAGSLDPWGASPALDLMRRVKAQFDPHGTLNPGRFVGGI